MKYLRKFATEADINIDALPCVALVASTGEVLYKPKPNNGVYIQHINGALYTTEEWSNNALSKDDANGVAVVSDACSFVIAKKITAQLYWSYNYNDDIDGVLLTDEEAVAKTDIKGYDNTLSIYQQAVADGKTAPAAQTCLDYTFPNGARGYLCAAGEWATIIPYSELVVEAMTLLGNTNITNTAFFVWTSTQATSFNAWTIALDKTSGKFELSQRMRNDSTNMAVYPFTHLNL